MTLTLPDGAVPAGGVRTALLAGPAVAPEDLLLAREGRVTRRRDMQRRHPRATVVTVSLVVPGPVKSSPRLQVVRDEAVRAVVRVCASHGWAVHQVEVHDDIAGPEAEVAVVAPAVPVKTATSWLEDHHPVGRLWDLDVHDADVPVSRTDLGQPARRCLVCDEPGHGCARARRHSAAEIVRALGVLDGRLG